MRKEISKFFATASTSSNKKRCSPEDAKNSCPPLKISKELGNIFSGKLKLFTFHEKPDKSNAFADQHQAGPSNLSSSWEPTKCEDPVTENVIEDSDEDDFQSCSIYDAVEKSKKFTPLEEQYLEFKNEYQDAILFIECGYKYRLFEDDARIASKELNIGCYMSHNFYSCSIPAHRLSIHVRRLVSNGHKVGIIKQTESTALKAAGKNKNTLFSRKLNALYTSATLIGENFNTTASTELNSDYELDPKASSTSGYIMCIHDKVIKNQNKLITTTGVLAVHPVAGEMYYASFSSNSGAKSDLESCIMQIDPDEIVLAKSPLTLKNEKLLKSYTETRNLKKSKLRIERVDDEAFEFSFALNKVATFSEENYSLLLPSEASVNSNLQDALNLPPLVICCISAIISYLQQFRLDILLKNLKNLKPLSDTSMHMKLNYLSIRNLEILKNNVNGSEEGTLLSVVNHTKTKFGARLLKSWLMKPLTDIRKIKERQDSTGELLNIEPSLWKHLEAMLCNLPDLERLLCAAFYHRCTCSEFITLVNSLVEVQNRMLEISEIVKESTNLRSAVTEFVILVNNIHRFQQKVDEMAAKNEDKTKIFNDDSKYPRILSCKQKIFDVEKQLYDQQTEIAKVLNLSSFNYSTVFDQKFLIEVENSKLPLVPSNWMNMGSTKQVTRFRSPEVESMYYMYQQLSEELLGHCEAAWNSFLDAFGNNYFTYKKALSILAEMDCFLSFARLAKQPGFCRPVISDTSDRQIDVVEGKNLVLAQILGEQAQYVTNDTKLFDNVNCVIITGPNMGGKSSYAKQIALISILAQVGCYVPATSARLPLFDGIYIRKGADDDLIGNRSTFMTEMLETSSILSSCTSNSLVILDELGRGTSTFDGAAIAHSIVNYLISEVKCTTFFITHFSQVAEDLQKVYPDHVRMFFVGFHISDHSDGQTSDIDDITFLYKVSAGLSRSSYGINVARLISIPEYILCQAKSKAAEFELLQKLESSSKEKYD